MSILTTASKTNSHHCLALSCTPLLLCQIGQQTSWDFIAGDRGQVKSNRCQVTYFFLFLKFLVLISAHHESFIVPVWGII